MDGYNTKFLYSQKKRVYVLFLATWYFIIPFSLLFSFYFFLLSLIYDFRGLRLYLLENRLASLFLFYYYWPLLVTSDLSSLILFSYSSSFLLCSVWDKIVDALYQEKNDTIL